MRHAPILLALVAFVSLPIAACRHAEVASSTSATTSSQTGSDARAAAECTVDADCHATSDYCGGCNCLALTASESAPTCDHPVQCFADPCMGKSAACVDGSCALR